MQIVQGDVFIVAASIPKGAKKIKRSKRGYVLAEGEATGHAHCIVEEIEMYEKGGVLYLKNDKPVDLRHEEHASVTIPKGEWQVGRVLEYDPFSEETKQVRD